MSKSTKIKEDKTLSFEFAPEKPNLDGDRINFYLLIVLYIIQGFLIGFSGALSIILQSQNIITYEDQAIFSIVIWPFMLKILWAPIVDALYVQWIGRRKSWLIPLQLLMVALMLYLANNIDKWLPETEKPNLKMIVFVIFMLNFLAATQDIVVDGWSLTMLKKKNVSYASTCNAIGLPIGMFIGSICFTLLVSEQFSNKYFRNTPGSGGLITMKNFLHSWVSVILLVTFSVTIFKKEKHYTEDEYKKINILQNYKLLWDILKKPGIKILAIALLTARIGFIATESVTHLKLIDAGVSKDDIMITNVMMYSVKISLPFLVSKHITGPNPMRIYLNLTPFRLFWGMVLAIFVYFTPRLIHTHGIIDVPVYYYFILGFVYLINEVLNYFMMVILYAFFCQISDPRHGGTYMTLFNTFYFIGWIVPNTFVLQLVNELTFSECSVDVQNFCTTSNLKNTCKMKGGSCIAYLDGYFIMMFVCTIIGFIWYGVFRNIINRYQSLGLFSYKACNQRSSTKEENEACVSLPL